MKEEILIEGLQEIIRTLELWRRPDNMAEQIAHIAEQVLFLYEENKEGK